MTRKTIRLAAAAALAIGLTAAAQAGPSTEQQLARMMAGESAKQGKELERAIAKAERFPLGDAQNPVRVTMPAGERAYLARQRCSDGRPPLFSRGGSTGEGPFGNIVDVYAVTCESGTPAAAQVYMDMYHGGFAETRPLPGFIVAE